jgi:hypothetical protein
MINMLEKMPDAAHLAKFLLVQADCAPASCNCKKKSACGHQYRIEVFEVGIFYIRIVDGGKEHWLKTNRVKEKFDVHL